MDLIRDLVHGRIPPRVMRFVKTVGRGVNRFSMIGGGDRVLLGVSGGKDSLALALALALRKRWLPVDYTLEGAMIEWKEYPHTAEQRRRMTEYFDILEIPLRVLGARMFSPGFKGAFNCYLCSRNRKRILFDLARELGIGTIALGHHMDDFIETTLINIAIRGQISTMMPVQLFFGGKLKIVRPMCLVKENAVTRLSAELALPVAQIECPYRTTNVRAKIKPIVRQLVHIDKHAREHIFSAPWHIDHDYLPRPADEP